MREVENYAMFRQIPVELKVKLSQYYDLKYNGRIFEENMFLDEVNHCLKQVKTRSIDSLRSHYMTLFSL